MNLLIFFLFITSSYAQFMDEMQTFEMDCLREDKFQCLSGGCVLLAQYCDGYVDCDDGTDENFCVEHLPDVALCNETHQYLCQDKKRCIPDSWVCNNEPDCEDASDEVDCTTPASVVNSTCKGFKCGDGRCISRLWVCDGVYDCPDKSDEQNLTLCRQSRLPYQNLDTSTCKFFAGTMYYKCLDGSFCLTADRMCDGLVDCRDGSDEGPFCANWNTMCNNFKCVSNSTSCHPNRDGPMCQCHSPYDNYQYNPTTGRCEDTDVCASERPNCSHKCIDYDGYFTCECEEGYHKDFFSYLCYAEGPEGMLFFSTKNEIKFLKLKTNQLVTVVSGVKQAHGVSYDGQYLYWVETAQGHQSIVRAHLEDIDGTKKVLLGFGLEDTGDISIDWLGGNLYFTDTIRNAIFACKLDASSCLTIKTNAKHPRYITVDPKRGKMYWADYIDHPVLMMAQMDGSNAQVLTDNLRTFASGLALDAPNDRLYFVDRTVKVVVISRKVVYSLFEEPFHHPYSIAVFENTVFWSDWTSNTLQTTDKLHDNRQLRRVLLTLPSPIYGMHVYHPAVQKSSWNPCSNHNCSHMCLVTSNATSVCACPDLMTLKENQCVHMESYRPQYIVIGGGQMLTRLEYNALSGAENHATYYDIGRLQAMAYDNFRDTLYIYDGQRRILSYVNMSDFTLGLAHTFLYQGLDNVVDMDYDFVSDSLYILDAGRKVLEVVSLKTLQRGLVYQFEELEIPISFCVMPNYGRLLVAVVEEELNNNIHIDSIGLDGQDRHHVIMNNLKGPHVRLRFSQVTDNVYISDEGNGIIDYMHPEGTGRENFRELSTTITSLALTDTYAFWTDRRTARLFWSDIHAARHTIRRIDLSLLPNTTLLVQSTMPYPDPSDRLLSHPCRRSNPCSDICVQTSTDNPHSQTFLGFRCLCPPGSLLKNGQCTKVVICTENELYCHSSNACISKSKYCDGVKDCASGEDEANCNAITSIISSKCSETEFECVGSGVCIGRSLMCDGRDDCPDGADEASTECQAMPCFETEFMCASGSCIPMTWKCDGDRDCNDATDEIGCENTTCKSGYYQCRNRGCIEVRKRCDGKQDCFDFSDEEDCDEQIFVENTEKPMPRCPSYEFACELNKSICLPLTARCNKNIDCPGATDESGCDFLCAPQGRFACKQQLWCVTYNRLCNGKKDCGDGSDETPDACALVNKTSFLYPLTVSEEECTEGFLCGSGQCLEWRQVCDKVQDCTDGTDEGGACLSSCTNHSCPEACIASPLGGRCACGAGRERAGGGCADRDECAAQPCAHVCTNTPGTYLCSCHRGYALRSDRHTCKAIRGNMSILYVSGNTIRSVSADGYGAVEYSDSSIASITDLDYDVRKNKLYVTSADSKSLIEVNGTHNVVTVTNIGRPTRVAVDWITGNVYFVDSSPENSRMRVCNVKKRRCANLQKLPSDAKVTSLVIDPKSRRMFYCVTRALESVVWSASLSGRNATDLTVVGNCTGLAVDSFKAQLYIAETGPPHIVRMDYDGQHHKKILYDHPQLEAPHTLAIFEDHIYYLVANSLRLGRCLLFGATHCETYIYRVFDANTFVIRHESVQRDDVTNHCDGVVCENVCVLDVAGYRCVCDDGDLAKDGACPLVNKKELPLFNGWSYQDYLRAHRASFTVITAVLVLLIGYLGIFVYYHFVYKPRRNRASAYTEVRYQNNPAGSAALSYGPPIDMITDGNIAHEFVNPLQYVRNVLRESFRRDKPIGTAGLSINFTNSPPQNCSDTESDLDDKENLVIRRKSDYNK